MLGEMRRLLALLLLAASPALAQPPEFPKRLQLRGVANAAQVSPVLYRGAQPTKEGFRELARAGVKTILSMRIGIDDGKILGELGLKSFRVPALQWRPDTKDVVAALKVIVTPAFQPVFVHCQAGKDRTGLVVAAYEILFQGRSVEEAITERRSFGALGLWAENERWLERLNNPSVKSGLVKMVESAPLPEPAP